MNVPAEEAIKKAQYMLKAKPLFFFFTKLNLAFLACSYIFTSDITSFLICYLTMAFLGYRFSFSLTKMDNPYNIFLLKFISNFIKNLRR